MADPTPQQTSELHSPAAPRRHWLGWVLTLLLIALLAGGAYYLVQRSKTPAAGAAGSGQRGPGGPGGPGPGGGGGRSSTTVGSAVAVQGALPVLVDALGTVTPPLTATLVPQVSGTLTEVLFAEGQMVQKGQVLARIDPRSFEQTLLQAQGQRARDEAQLAAARVTLQRYETLWKQDSIARQEVDTQAALVKQLQGTVEADRASERAAQINVGYATIKAPITGRIGLRTVDPGNLVSSGSSTGIATITQINPIDVVFAVPQERVPDVLAAAKAGKLPVSALDRARTQTLAEGTFLTLDNQVNVSSGTVKAKARFAKADGTLFPNQFVNVRLQLGSQPGVLVPVTAVRTGPNGDYVYVIDEDSKAHMRSIRRGLATAEQTLITDGLQAGERVVTEGGDRVRDGGRVQMAAASAPAGAASGARAAGRPWGAASGPRRQRASAPEGAQPSGFEGNRPSAGASTAQAAAKSVADGAAGLPSGGANPPAAGASRARMGASGAAFMDRLPPEVRAKVLTMSPEERHAYFQQLRAAREARGEDSGPRGPRPASAGQ